MFNQNLRKTVKKFVFLMLLLLVGVVSYAGSDPPCEKGKSIMKEFVVGTVNAATPFVVIDPIFSNLPRFGQILVGTAAMQAAYTLTVGSPPTQGTAIHNSDYLDHTFAPEKEIICPRPTLRYVDVFIACIEKPKNCLSIPEVVRLFSSEDRS